MARRTKLQSGCIQPPITIVDELCVPSEAYRSCKQIVRVHSHNIIKTFQDDIWMGDANWKRSTMYSTRGHRTYVRNCSELFVVR